MAKPELILTDHNLVIAGSHNPTLFHPNWFGQYNLISPADIHESENQGNPENSPIQIMHRELTLLEFDWVRIEVTQEQWIARTKNESYFEAIRDLVSGTFFILKNSPVLAVGINFEFHYRLHDQKQLKNLLQMISPPKIWSQHLQEVTPVQMVFRDHGREGNYPGFTQFQVQTDAKNGPLGVSISVNDHFPLVAENQFANGVAVHQLVENEWQTSVKRIQQLVGQLIEKI